MLQMQRRNWYKGPKIELGAFDEEGSQRAWTRRQKIKGEEGKGAQGPIQKLWFSSQVTRKPVERQSLKIQFLDLKGQ